MIYCLYALGTALCGVKYIVQNVMRSAQVSQEAGRVRAFARTNTFLFTWHIRSCQPIKQVLLRWVVVEHFRCDATRPVNKHTCVTRSFLMSYLRLELFYLQRTICIHERKKYTRYSGLLVPVFSANKYLSTTECVVYTRY